jgi:hypothetical protein
LPGDCFQVRAASWHSAKCEELEALKSDPQIVGLLLRGLASLLPELGQLGAAEVGIAGEAVKCVEKRGVDVRHKPESSVNRRRVAL